MNKSNRKRSSIFLGIIASLKSRIGILILLGTLVTFVAVWRIHIYSSNPIISLMDKEDMNRFETNSEYAFLAEILEKISSLSANINKLLLPLSNRKQKPNGAYRIYELEIDNIISELHDMSDSTRVQEDKFHYKKLREILNTYILSADTIQKLADNIATNKQEWVRVEPALKVKLDEADSLLLTLNSILSKKMMRLKRDYEDGYFTDLAIQDSMQEEMDRFTIALSLLIIFSGIIFTIINGKREIETTLLVENEKALKKSEDEIRSIFRTVGEGIVVIGSDSKILLVNEEIKKIFGYEDGELIGQNITILMPKKYKQLHTDAFNRYISGAAPQMLGKRLELDGLHKNGNTFPIELRVEATIEESGNRYFTGAIRDISARKIAEGRADMFYRMVEASSQGIGMANLDARVTYMNPALCTMLGEPDSKAMHGRFIQEFYTPLARREVETIVMPTVIEKGSWEGEITLMGKDGKTVPVIENIFCVRNKDGSPSYFSTVITDITERKKMEEEQKILVKQSIEALKEAEREREKSEQANQLKSEFLANMSHELKTPLSSVLGFTRLALKGCEAISSALKDSKTLNLADKELDAITRVMKESKEAVGYNDIVLKQGEKLSGLINELLDLSLIEAGQLKLERARISASTLLTSVIDSVSHMASEKGIYLDTNADELNKSNLLFWGDEIRLEQIVRNLAENGIKYSKAGRVTISIKELNNKLSIKVSDEGIGISQDERETIFERFRQLDGSATRSHGGIGLGLSLVKKLTESMDGEILLESAPMKGSTFILTFPLEKVAEDGTKES